MTGGLEIPTAPTVMATTAPGVTAGLEIPPTRDPTRPCSREIGLLGFWTPATTSPAPPVGAPPAGGVWKQTPLSTVLPGRTLPLRPRSRAGRAANTGQNPITAPRGAGGAIGAHTVHPGAFWCQGRRQGVPPGCR